MNLARNTIQFRYEQETPEEIQMRNDKQKKYQQELLNQIKQNELKQQQQKLKKEIDDKLENDRIEKEREVIKRRRIESRMKNMEKALNDNNPIQAPSHNKKDIDHQFFNKNHNLSQKELNQENPEGDVLDDFLKQSNHQNNTHQIHQSQFEQPHYKPPSNQYQNYQNNYNSNQYQHQNNPHFFAQPQPQSQFPSPSPQQPYNQPFQRNYLSTNDMLIQQLLLENIQKQKSDEEIKKHQMQEEILNLKE
jgi:hypothetical protein